MEAMSQRVDDLARQMSDMMALLRESMLQKTPAPIPVEGRAPVETRANEEGGPSAQMNDAPTKPNFVINLTEEEEKQRATEKGKAKEHVEPEGYLELEEVAEIGKSPASRAGQLTETEKLEKIMRGMQEELRALKGEQSYSRMDLMQFGVTVDMVLPRDFKMPDMEKFSGTTDPVQHLKLYCTKMTIWSRDPTFLMGLFHESLSGAAFQWFIDLESEQRQDWDNFCHLFVEEYGFNQEVEPTREDLGRMKKKGEETFRQYAQRWRGTAKRVKPLLSPKELNDYFLGTLEECYVSKMIGSTYPTFSSLVEVGERIETLIMRGKVSKEPKENPSQTNNKKGFGQKKDVNMIQSHFRPPFQPTPPPLLPYHYPIQTTLGHYPPPSNTITPYFPQNPYPHNLNHAPLSIPNRPPSNVQNNNNRPTRGNQRPRDDRPFPNFNVPKQELLNRLLESQVITLLPRENWDPPYPHWYRMNERCSFHSGTAGHSLETCRRFQRAVLDLLDRNVIILDKQPAPNVQTNPLPNHAAGGAPVNAAEVGEDPMIWGEKDLGSLGVIKEGLERAGYDIGKIENEKDFQGKVQQLMALGVIQRGKRQRDVNVIDQPVLRFIVPSPFPHDDTHAVPWRYETQVVVNQTEQPSHQSSNSVGFTIRKPSQTKYQTESSPSSSSVGFTIRKLLQSEGVSQEAASLSNERVRFTIKKPSQDEREERVGIQIKEQADVGGITRTGRCYTSEETERLRRESTRMMEAAPPRLSQSREGEEEEFLRIMKQSEYSIMEQLKKTPARISLYSLIMSSEVHRKALQEVLSKAFVRPDATVASIVEMVDPIRHANEISFSIDEIDDQALKGPRALHISLKCGDHTVAGVLIDGGSALNVLPYRTLQYLPVRREEMRNSTMVVKAFDGTASRTIGKITLSLMVGPTLFETEMEVMDIAPSYTMLLGRPWIHSAQAVPSSLHQKLKFIHNGAVITVRGQEDIMVMRSGLVPYLEGPGETAEGAFHSFEVLDGAINMGEIMREPVALRIMKKSGYCPGAGLGSRTQGIVEPISLRGNEGKTGLGYEWTLEGAFKKARLDGRIPPLSQSFTGPVEVMGSEDSVEVDMMELDQLGVTGPMEGMDTEDVMEVDMMEMDQPDEQPAVTEGRGQDRNWEISYLPDVVSIM